MLWAPGSLKCSDQEKKRKAAQSLTGVFSLWIKKLILVKK